MKKKISPILPNPVDAEVQRAIQYLEFLVSNVTAIRHEGVNTGLTQGDRVQISQSFGIIKRAIAGI